MMMNWTLSSSARADGPVVAINISSKEALLSAIEDRTVLGEGFTVATLNLDHVVKLQQLPAFRTAYSRHSHVVADGNPVVWLSRLAGHRIDLVPGSELVEPVAGLAARTGAKVALLGSSEEALERAARDLSNRHPGLQVVLCHAPPMGFEPEGPAADEAIAKLAASGAQICFLALGAPKQEIFAVRAHEALPGTGFLSIGAGLDFIAGTQTRAPRAVRRLAGEWLWRLAGNPRRLVPRYAACIAILPRLAGAALLNRRRSRP